MNLFLICFTFLLFVNNGENNKIAVNNKNITALNNNNYPKSIDGDTIYFKDGFLLSYSEKFEQPKWVFYTIKINDINCSVKAKREKSVFKNDFEIITGSATLDDYRNSGYDRGHLKPSADESCDQRQMNETFLMSNMSPQNPSFNRGVWKDLENYVRKLTYNYDSIQVITGGNLNDNNLIRIGKNKVGVPNYYYKVLYKYKGGQKTIECFYLPNKKNTNFRDFKLNILELEKKINIKFK